MPTPGASSAPGSDQHSKTRASAMAFGFEVNWGRSTPTTFNPKVQARAQFNALEQADHKASTRASKGQSISPAAALAKDNKDVTARLVKAALDFLASFPRSALPRDLELKLLDGFLPGARYHAYARGPAREPRVARP